MNHNDIKIDKEGLWYYKGAHMFRKEIVNLFFDHLKLDACGKYLIELGPERCYLDVEDTAFVVLAVYRTRNPNSGREQIEVLLNDDSCEILDVTSLQEGRENILYCRVKNGRFAARFVRKSYYQIAEFIETSENESRFYITLNGEQYYIHKNENQAI